MYGTKLKADLIIFLGDSGSGFFVRNENSYQIYGIVSAATVEECAENLYVVFTSVPKFMDWIDDITDGNRCKRNVKCRIESSDR